MSRFFEYTHFRCICADPNHQFNIVSFLDSEDDECWIQIKLTNHNSFWQRLKSAFYYIFNIKNRNLDWDEIILDTKTRQELISKLQTFDLQVSPKIYENNLTQ